MGKCYGEIIGASDINAGAVRIRPFFHRPEIFIGNIDHRTVNMADVETAQVKQFSFEKVTTD